MLPQVQVTLYFLIRPRATVGSRKHEVQVTVTMASEQVDCVIVHRMQNKDRSSLWALLRSANLRTESRSL